MVQSRSLLFGRWPRFIARHPWRVLLGAILLLIVLGGVSTAANGKFADQFSIPGTEAQQAQDLLQSRFPQAAGDSTTVVIKAPAGIRTPAIHARVDEVLRELRALPDVVSVSSPYSVPGDIAPGGTLAQFTVQYDKQASKLSTASLDALTHLQQRVSAPPAFQVELGGQVASAADQPSLGNSELYGILAAVVVLLVAFGSVVAMGLPVVTALIGVMAGTFTVMLLATFLKMPSFTQAFTLMIGLGVGIDYALLIVTRFRTELHRGLTVSDAVEVAIATAGRTVLFAGAAVVAANLGLWLIGIPFVAYVGTAAAVVVAFAVVVANSILPAILTLVGTRIDALHVPGVSIVERENGLARRLGRLSRRSPKLVAVAAAGLVVLIAVPFFSLNLGSSDAGSSPTSMTTRRAYDLIAEGFGPGVNGPIILAVAINQPSAIGAVEQLPQRLRATPGVASIAPAQFNPAKTAATIVIIPTTSPQSDATKALVQRLKDSIPSALGGADATVYVGGPTATFVDVGNKISSALPLFFAVVIVFGFLILMAVFRSILIPLIAAAMNILSVGAALGVLVAVFQWGWLGTLIGVSRTGPVESFMPIFLFAVLFGLSMDYQVFLVSRIQEEHLHGRRNADAVENGLSLTTRLIGAAALIMGAVFLSFALGDQRVIKEFGLGLGVAVFIDAFVIRLFLVPALMQLFGEANWWFPRWLDRIVPNVSIEGPSDLTDTAATESAA